LFEASVNKMINLDFSKLGILIGYRRSDYVDRGMLIAIHASKLAKNNTNIIQARFFMEIYHTLIKSNTMSYSLLKILLLQVFYDASFLSLNCLEYIKRVKVTYADRFLFIDINEVHDVKLKKLDEIELDIRVDAGKFTEAISFLILYCCYCI
jgi:hypothetical protein